MEFKSQYEILRERLIGEGKLKELTPAESFKILADLHAKFSEGESEIKKDELEAEQELATLLLNA